MTNLTYRSLICLTRCSYRWDHRVGRIRNERNGDTSTSKFE